MEIIWPEWTLDQASVTVGQAVAPTRERSLDSAPISIPAGFLADGGCGTGGFFGKERTNEQRGVGAGPG